MSRIMKRSAEKYKIVYELCDKIDNKGFER